MAVSDSREVVIEATPEEILDVIADVESAPDWSSQHQGAEILDRVEGGRPGRVKLKLKTMGIADEQVVQYEWTDSSAGWSLISSSQLKTQDAKYTLTPDGDKTRVKLLLPLGSRARRGHCTTQPARAAGSSRLEP